MIKIYLIRHGMTPGNKLSRYIGSTDEALSEEGREELRQLKEDIYDQYEVDRLFMSPMKRCLETAEILFPDHKEKTVIDDLREFDFGVFENKNYKELSDSKEYQAWVDSYCLDPVPGGESMDNFKRRSCRAFDEVVEKCLRNQVNTAAVVVHGGTIMSLMEMYAVEKKSYYDWHVKNGRGYQIELDPETFLAGSKEFYSSLFM